MVLARRLAALVLGAGIAALGTAQAASAVSGQVSHRGRPASGAAVELACGADEPGKASTDGYGRFRVQPGGSARECTLTIEYQGRRSEPYKPGSRRSLNIELRRWNEIWLLVVR